VAARLNADCPKKLDRLIAVSPHLGHRDHRRFKVRHRHRLA
jgi:hypothetical protein